MTQPYNSRPANFTEGGQALTNQAVTVFAYKADRRGAIVSNNSDTDMVVRIGDTASATAGITVSAGRHIAFKGDHCPTGLISVFCAGTSKTFTAYQW